MAVELLCRLEIVFIFNFTVFSRGCVTWMWTWIMFWRYVDFFFSPLVFQTSEWIGATALTVCEVTGVCTVIDKAQNTDTLQPAVGF